jgi:hypothetical protein
MLVALIIFAVALGMVSKRNGYWSGRVFEICQSNLFCSRTSHCWTLYRRVQHKGRFFRWHYDPPFRHGRAAARRRISTLLWMSQQHPLKTQPLQRRFLRTRPLL